MLRRSCELFRWARERRRDSDRLTEPSMFRQLSRRWEPVTPVAPAAEVIIESRTRRLVFAWPRITRV